MKYDDKRLRLLFAELDPKGRKKVIKNACRRVGTKVRKVAVDNLRASSLGKANAMRDGVRSVVFNREAGVRVTVATKGGKGMHTNRKGKTKPILMWAETGTKKRESKKATRYLVGGEWRTGRYRGAMKRFGFIAKTQRQVRHTAGEQMKEEVANQVLKIAKKHGCC